MRLDCVDGRILICIKTVKHLPWPVHRAETGEPGDGHARMQRWHSGRRHRLAVLLGYGDVQQIGQPGRGLALAQRLCSQCHAVRKEQAQSPNQNAPRFQVIASVPGMTSIALSAALNTSHRTMPNIMLQADEAGRRHRRNSVSSDRFRPLV